MRVSQKQSYKSTTTISKNHSNFYIMDKIRDFLCPDVKNVTEIQRNKPNYIELAYGAEVRTTKKLSCDILINYLTNFPLFSSKYLDFLD
jgi:hypothetical protein